MTYLQAILLGIVQGLTEFLPVSSSGHLALGQHILGLKDVDISFDLLLHAATLLSVLIYFRKRLFQLLRSLWTPSAKQEHKMILFLAISTLPIVIAGLLFSDSLEHAKEYPRVVAGLLCATGVILLLPGLLKRETSGTAELTLKNTLWMGLVQSLALLPGISRSGSTVAAGMIAGIKPAVAAEFSFLLAIPAISGAIVLKSDVISQLPADQLGPYIAGMIAAFASGMAAISGLLATIRSGKFRYFAYYCLSVGLAALFFFSVTA